MNTPREIIDGLECVISVYFSDIRHRLRAAFILADELAEMACKTRALQSCPSLGHIKFLPLLRHPAVRLDPAASPLGAALSANHRTRNQLHHVNAALSVDDQHCADAIIDGLALIDHCFPGTLAVLPYQLRVSIRVVRLHSGQGDVGIRGRFEDAMRAHRWNGANRPARVSEPPVAVGTRRYWGLVILSEYVQIESILNRVGAP